MVSKIKVNLFYINNLGRLSMSREELSKHKYKLFMVGAIGTFMATLDGSIVNVALPTISTALSVPVDIVAWVAMAYSLTLISLMLIFGAWVKNRGYFFGYRFGYAFFLTGSIMCTFSHSIWLLVAARIIQAIGTAMFASIGPGMVTTVFGDKERGKGIGMMVMMVAGGFMVGPPLGGFLLGFFNWQAIFVINIPIGIIGMLMTYRYIKLIPHKRLSEKLHIQSAIAISVGLVLLTICMSLINDYPVSDFRVWGFLIPIVLCLIFFIKYERNPVTAMIGLDIFKNKQFTGSIVAMLFMFIALSGISILIPFYLEHIKGYVPNQVGLFLIILPIMMFIFAPLSGRLSDKIGFRILTVSGLVFLMTGLYLISYYNSATSPYYIIASFVVLGFGLGIFNTPNSSALMGSVGEEHRAVTSSILGTTRNIGMSLGVALMTTLFAYFQNQNSSLGDEKMIFIASFKPVVYLAIGIASLSLIASIFRDNKLKEKDIADDTRKTVDRM